MTFAELDRAAHAWQRTQRRELQEKARLSHILADLIGHSVARIYSQNAKMPTLQEAFPTIFDEPEATEAEKEKQNNAIMELSALRFRQFAAAHNKKKGGAKGIE